MNTTVLLIVGELVFLLVMFAVGMSVIGWRRKKALINALDVTLKKIAKAEPERKQTLQHKLVHGFRIDAENAATMSSEIIQAERRFFQAFTEQQLNADLKALGSFHKTVYTLLDKYWEFLPEDPILDSPQPAGVAAADVPVQETGLSADTAETEADTALPASEAGDPVDSELDIDVAPPEEDDVSVDLDIDIDTVTSDGEAAGDEPSLQSAEAVSSDGADEVVEAALAGLEEAVADDPPESGESAAEQDDAVGAEVDEEPSWDDAFMEISGSDSEEDTDPDSSDGQEPGWEEALKEAGSSPRS